MGPVSFSSLSFDDREAALDAARRLTAAGIRIEATDGASILVRGDDYTAATQLLADGADSSSTHRVEPLMRTFDAVLSLPGSKSHTNRALLCAALAPVVQNYAGY